MSAIPLHAHELRLRNAGRRTFDAPAWLREPLLHFLLLGGVLYAASRVFAPVADNTRIVVDAARVERLVRLYELQTGASPGDAQREQLIEDFVRDEVLYREARKLGLDEGDELVRRRLVQKMEFLEASNSEPAAPTDAQLRAFQRKHAAQFAAPSRVSFSQVYFSPDRRGREAARDAAAELAVHRSTGAEITGGDRSPVANNLDNVTRDEVQLAFGQTPIVDALMKAPPGQWVGPIESGYGWHLVRVRERAGPMPLTFEQAREAVTTAWEREARLQAERAGLATLTRKYTVIRNDQIAAVR